MAEEVGEHANGGADNCNRQEGKAPPLHAQRVQRPNVSRVERTCTESGNIVSITAEEVLATFCRPICLLGLSGTMQLCSSMAVQITGNHRESALGPQMFTVLTHPAWRLQRR